MEEDYTAGAQGLQDVMDTNEMDCTNLGPKESYRPYAPVK